MELIWEYNLLKCEMKKRRKIIVIKKRVNSSLFNIF